jgi:hypothetical protein
MIHSPSATREHSSFPVNLVQTVPISWNNAVRQEATELKGGSRRILPTIAHVHVRYPVPGSFGGLVVVVVGA